ncbi:MAG: biotin--[acetyl-CoA-carboxylase] ligase [Gemmatimonadota bacterium]|jgi:BirA family biotin operon repressor/biotin-[acetyl-CoA-carboxylase] ligase
MSKRSGSDWDAHTEAELRERWNRESVHLRERVDSTNEAAKLLAEEGAPDGTIVIAREQTKGRGRAGAQWYSPRDGGIYLSMVYHPRDLSHPAPLVILAGLGIAQELETSFPGLRPMLKWPNDLIIGDRKAGGLLAEAAWSDAAPRYLVVGVGLNVRPFGKKGPKEVRERATALDDHLDSPADLVEVADAVIRGLEEHLSHPEPVLSPALLAELDRRDWLRDRRVVLTVPGVEQDSRTPGVSVGIAPDGALLFRPDRGALRRIMKGSVAAD